MEKGAALILSIKGRVLCDHASYLSSAMSSLSDIDSEKIRELKKEHDDLVEQNRLVDIRFERVCLERIQFLENEQQAWLCEKKDLLNKISVLSNDLDSEKSRNIIMMLEKAGHLAGILSATLAEHRAAKRQRESE